MVSKIGYFVCGKLITNAFCRGNSDKAKFIVVSSTDDGLLSYTKHFCCLS